MKKIFHLMMAVLAGASVVSCQNFLSASSPSTVDADFVFSSYETGKTVMLGAYNTVTGSYTSGLPTNFDDIGSDTERCSVGMVAALVGAAQLYGGQPSYTVENYNINDGSVPGGNWNTFYSAINRCNQVIANIQALSDYDEIIATAPNDWSDLLGQAYAMRATMYLELIIHWGDVIYYTEEELGQDIKELTNRDYILESEIAAMEKAEKWMYAIGEQSHLPDQMTRNYADGLIGRLCFWAAGFQTRRTDLEGGMAFYTDIDGKAISFETWGEDPARNASYGRRSDWKKFYTKAIPYLEKGVNQPAGASLTTVDPRSDKEGRTYGNPFQYYFDQVTKQIMPEESIFEWSIKEQNGNSRIAYNFGRGSSGGSPAYPPKANAQTCTYPAVFYGMFDPQDMRRDASVNVTGSNGSGVEAIYTYALSNRLTIGIGMNKYDLNRQVNPDARQLFSGINYVYMRQADIILMLAEAYAVNGDNAKATTELRKIHDRAFADDIQDAKFSELLASVDGDLYEAVIEERKLEFVGETNRRFDLIRTGKLPHVAYEFRKQLVDQMAELRKNGYVQFDNGNQYPDWIWIKTLNAKEILGYRLTMQTPAGLTEGTDEYGLLVPGWRGQHDDWNAVAEEDGKKGAIVMDNTNVAIQGLFRYIDPDSAEAKALEARGYTKTAWGSGTYTLKSLGEEYSPAVEAQWSSEFMCGYTDADYAAKKAPIYLMPMNETTCLTTGLKNGYGFNSPNK
ncbi:MAG: RagB/SusD family nutrient uptake outer membrane protein [Bacteroidales bacterium]|nr:RagB/SusD family nutrient uptake outer membrane protein [Bacteroidales bacterium]